MLLLLAVPAGAQSATRAAPDTFQFALANGMQVLVIPDHRAPVVTQMLWFKVGGVDDPPGRIAVDADPVRPGHRQPVAEQLLQQRVAHRLHAHFHSGGIEQALDVQPQRLARVVAGLDPQAGAQRPGRIQPSAVQARCRIDAECSPTPPVNTSASSPPADAAIAAIPPTSR